jgi:hypothetical protein
MDFEIITYVDGEEPECLEEVIATFTRHWDSNFSDIGNLSFYEPINFKTNDEYKSLPKVLKKVSSIRNPDIYFYCKTIEREIGGIEITVHSPDGSNVEKRYPFIWASRKNNTNAFIASPYMKVRPNGSMNKLPHRHSQRNLDLLSEWDFENNTTIQQIVPTINLQEQIDKLPDNIRDHMLTWEDYAIFLSSYLAYIISSSDKALNNLNEIKNKLRNLATACKGNTKYTSPSTFIEHQNRWIQIYNSRPDSGHWERGEGQFDSIDGRLMFTLDQIDFLDPSNKPDSFEFWLPQMSRSHAWIKEQEQRGYGSKRLRNIIIELKKFCTVKFMEDLTDDDIILLKENPTLTLERLDWDNNIYSVLELLNGHQPSDIAKKGLKSPSRQLIRDLTNIFNRQDLYLSTHRIYFDECINDFVEKINLLPDNSSVLAPRLYRDLFNDETINKSVQIKFGAECTKDELLALRQLHRYKAR